MAFISFISVLAVMAAIASSIILYFDFKKEKLSKA